MFDVDFENSGVHLVLLYLSELKQSFFGILHKNLHSVPCIRIFRSLKWMLKEERTEKWTCFAKQKIWVSFSLKIYWFNIHTKPIQRAPDICQFLIKLILIFINIVCFKCKCGYKHGRWQCHVKC